MAGIELNVTVFAQFNEELERFNRLSDTAGTRFTSVADGFKKVLTQVAKIDNNMLNGLSLLSDKMKVFSESAKTINALNFTNFDNLKSALDSIKNIGDMELPNIEEFVSKLETKIQGDLSKKVVKIDIEKEIGNKLKDEIRELFAGFSKVDEVVIDSLKSSMESIGKVLNDSFENIFVKYKPIFVNITKDFFKEVFVDAFKFDTTGVADNIVEEYTKTAGNIVNRLSGSKDAIGNSSKTEDIFVPSDTLLTKLDDIFAKIVNKYIGFNDTIQSKILIIKDTLDDFQKLFKFADINLGTKFNSIEEDFTLFNGALSDAIDKIKETIGKIKIAFDAVDIKFDPTSMRTKLSESLQSIDLDATGMNLDFTKMLRFDNAEISTSVDAFIDKYVETVREKIYAANTKLKTTGTTFSKNILGVFDFGDENSLNAVKTSMSNLINTVVNNFRDKVYAANVKIKATGETFKSNILKVFNDPEFTKVVINSDFVFDDGKYIAKLKEAFDAVIRDVKEAYKAFEIDLQDYFKKIQEFYNEFSGLRVAPVDVKIKKLISTVAAFRSFVEIDEKVDSVTVKAKIHIFKDFIVKVTDFLTHDLNSLLMKTEGIDDVIKRSNKIAHAIHVVISSFQKIAEAIYYYDKDNQKITAISNKKFASGFQEYYTEVIKFFKNVFTYDALTVLTNLKLDDDVSVNISKVTKTLIEIVKQFEKLSGENIIKTDNIKNNFNSIMSLFVGDDSFFEKLEKIGTKKPTEKLVALINDTIKIFKNINLNKDLDLTKVIGFFNNLTKNVMPSIYRYMMSISNSVGTYKSKNVSTLVRAVKDVVELFAVLQKTPDINEKLIMERLGKIINVIVSPRWNVWKRFRNSTLTKLINSFSRMKIDNVEKFKVSVNSLAKLTNTMKNIGEVPADFAIKFKRLIEGLSEVFGKKGIKLLNLLSFGRFQKDTGVAKFINQFSRIDFKNVDKLKMLANSIMKLVSAFEKIENLKGVNLQKNAQTIIQVANQITEGLKKPFTIMSIPRAILNFPKLIFNVIVGGIRRLFRMRSPSKATQELGENITKGFENGVEKSNFFSNFFSKISDGFKRLGTNINNFFVRIVRSIKNFAGLLVRPLSLFSNTIKNVFSKTFNFIKSRLVLTFSDIGNVVRNTMQTLIGNFNTYELGLTRVFKTIDLGGNELEESLNKEYLVEMFRQLSILDSSNLSGIENASDEISKIAEAAGSLGIPIKDMKEFVTVAGQMSLATDISSDEAATFFGQFGAITNTNQYERIGSTMVKLGNDFAATESKIADFSLRLAGAGEGAGFKESDILALSAALASVGFEAEAGGTAMSTVINTMVKATSDGGAKLQTFARVTGQSTAEFAKAFEEKPAEALNDFIVGLGKLDGNQQLRIIDQLGLDGIRTTDALRRLANAGDVFTDALGVANEAWLDNNALVNEANQLQDTVYFKQNRFRNLLKDTSISIGRVLSVPYKDLLDGLNSFLNSVSETLYRFSISEIPQNLWNGVMSFFRSGFEKVNNSIIGDLTKKLTNLKNEVFNIYTFGFNSGEKKNTLLKSITEKEKLYQDLMAAGREAEAYEISNQITGMKSKISLYDKYSTILSSIKNQFSTISLLTKNLFRGDFKSSMNLISLRTRGFTQRLKTQNKELEETVKLYSEGAVDSKQMLKVLSDTGWRRSISVLGGLTDVKYTPVAKEFKKDMDELLKNGEISAEEYKNVTNKIFYGLGQAPGETIYDNPFIIGVHKITSEAKDELLNKDWTSFYSTVGEVVRFGLVKAIQNALGFVGKNKEKLYGTDLSLSDSGFLEFEQDEATNPIIKGMLKIAEGNFTPIQNAIRDNLSLVIQTGIKMAIGIVFPPAGAVIGVASLLSKSIENDFLGFRTMLEQTEIGKYIVSGFDFINDTIESVINGIFGSGESESRYEKTLSNSMSYVVGLSDSVGSVFDSEVVTSVVEKRTPWQRFTDTLNKMIEDIKNVIKRIGEEIKFEELEKFFNKIWTGLQPFVENFFANRFTAFGTILNNIFETVIYIVENYDLYDLVSFVLLVDGITNGFGRIKTFISNFAKGWAVYGALMGIGYALDEIAIFVDKVGNMIKAFFAGDTEGLLQNGGEAFTAFANGLIDFVTGVGDALNLWNWVGKLFGQTPEEFKAAFLRSANVIKIWAQDAVSTITQITLQAQLTIARFKASLGDTTAAAQIGGLERQIVYTEMGRDFGYNMANQIGDGIKDGIDTIIKDPERGYQFSIEDFIGSPELMATAGVETYKQLETFADKLLGTGEFHNIFDAKKIYDAIGLDFNLDAYLLENPPKLSGATLRDTIQNALAIEESGIDYSGLKLSIASFEDFKILVEEGALDAAYISFPENFTLIDSIQKMFELGSISNFNPEDFTYTPELANQMRDFIGGGVSSLLTKGIELYKQTRSTESTIDAGMNEVASGVAESIRNDLSGVLSSLIYLNADNRTQEEKDFFNEQIATFLNVSLDEALAQYKFSPDQQALILSSVVNEMAGQGLTPEQVKQILFSDEMNSDYVQEFVDIGTNIMSGIYNGYVNNTNLVLDENKSLIDDIQEQLVTGFDMHSPSKYMENVGLNIITGLYNGLSTNKETIVLIVNELVAEVQRISLPFYKLIIDLALFNITFFGAMQTFKINKNIFKTELQDLIDKIDDVGAAFARMAVSASVSVPNVKPINPDGTKYYGGNIQQGRIYEILENNLPFEVFETSGRQYFIPNKNGYMHSPASSEMNRSAGVGSNNINNYQNNNVVINVNGNNKNPEAVADAVYKKLEKQKQQARRKLLLSGTSGV